MSKNLAPWAGAIVEAEGSFTEIASEEGNLVTYKKEAVFAMQALQSNEYLQKTNPITIMDSVINVASIGLSLNPALAFAYLVPRDGRCILDISYKGMVKIATDTGSILWAKAEVVREGDNFAYNGFGLLPDHKYNPFDKMRGNVIGAYCVARLSDGGYMVEVMSLDELNKVKDTSKAKNGPWKTWPEEMMKKTIIKRAYKSWPKTSPRLATAVKIVNEHEGIDLDVGGQQAGMQPRQLISQDQIDKLNNGLLKANIGADELCQYLGFEAMNEITTDKIKSAIQYIQNMIEANNNG